MINIKIAHIVLCNRVVKMVFFLSLIICIGPVYAAEHLYLPAGEKNYLANSQVKIDAITYATRSGEFVMNVIDDYQDGSYKITSLIDQEDGDDPFSIEAVLADNNGVVHHGTKRKGGTRCIATGYALHRSCSTIAKFEQNDGGYYKSFILNELDSSGKLVREMARGEMPELQFSLDKNNDALIIKNITATPLKIVKTISGKSVKVPKDSFLAISPGHDCDIKLEIGMCANDMDDAYSFVDSIKFYCESTEFEGQIIYEIHFLCSCNPYKAGVALAVADLNTCYEQVEKIGTELQMYRSNSSSSAYSNLQPLQLNKISSYSDKLPVGTVQTLKYKLTNNKDIDVPLEISTFDSGTHIYRDNVVDDSCGSSLGSNKSCTIRMWVYSAIPINIDEKMTIRSLENFVFEPIKIDIFPRKYEGDSLQVKPLANIAIGDLIGAKGFYARLTSGESNEKTTSNKNSFWGSIYNIICQTGELVNVAGYTNDDLYDICLSNFNNFNKERMENGAAQLKYVLKNNMDKLIKITAIEVIDVNYDNDRNNFQVLDYMKIMLPGKEQSLSISVDTKNFNDLFRTLSIRFKRCALHSWWCDAAESVKYLPILIHRP